MILGAGAETFEGRGRQGWFLYCHCVRNDSRVPIPVLGSNRKRSMAERVEKSKAVIVTMAPRL